MLDTYLGKVPEKFTYNGVEYTPKSFAESLGIKSSDYIPLTSFTHHDFYKPFAIEVPDNWLWSQYYNIPLNELMETIDYSIDKGYTVMWASDVSEKGFQYLKGFAVVPVEKKNDNLSGTELARWVKLSKAEKEGELYKFEEPEEEMSSTRRCARRLLTTTRQPTTTAWCSWVRLSTRTVRSTTR